MAGKAIVADHLQRQAECGPWPGELDRVVSAAMFDEAAEEIADWPGYRPTPLVELDRLADRLGLAAVHYKDEGERLGLGSFKALGGAYAVLRLAADHVAAQTGRRPDPAAIREGGHRDDLQGLTVVTATDGNHGRSVAWGAEMAGCRCRIYIHAGVSKGRQQAMEAFGAEVVRIEGDYDESVRLCAEEAEANGWQVVSDTSWDGYMEVPRLVMAGYGVMAGEAMAQLPQPPTHVFVQAGVGGLAAAVCAAMWQRLGPARPRFVIVEPTRAACLMATARAGRPTSVVLEEETVMAGLSCGEVSLLAWEVLSRGAADYITIGEEMVAPAMRLLAAGAAGGGPITAGESAVPGLIGLIGAAADPDLKAAIGLDESSRVLVFGCEGATDPAIYRRIVEGDGPGARLDDLIDG
ncbi:MAG: diaminopropionate ammonia-lyase [Rhizobiales bacterium NRL2]|jgi:diaminopropionate ammonia-lyase|nr:MAG: diaminopropionate ammonia-lyase [Rhizobiales bacterium NRL2]